MFISTASADGAASAAPAPCTARAAISMPAEVANPPASEAMLNSGDARR